MSHSDRTTARWIAVGDSFTAGTGDDPEHGGWIARTAAALIDAGRVDELHNLAEPGVHIDAVLHGQLPLLAEQAEVVSAIAGANDLMARRCDMSLVLGQVDQLLDWALGHAAVVLGVTCPDFLVSRSGRLRYLPERIVAINDHVEGRRAEAGDRFVVVDAHAILTDRALWADDGVHANPHGHELLAAAAVPLLEKALTTAGR